MGPIYHRLFVPSENAALSDANIETLVGGQHDEAIFVNAMPPVIFVVCG
jgi:hypothetical protein